MSLKQAIPLEAVIEESLGDRVFRACLPNGHQLVAFLGKQDEKKLKNRLVKGVNVNLICSPFDFSKGRITNLKEKDL